MRWFTDLKISKKLISSFTLISLISGIMGAFAIINLKSLNNLDTELYKNMTVPISQMAEISTEFERMRVSARDMIIVQSSDDIAANIQKIEDKRANIDKLSEEFNKTIISEEMKKQFDIFKAARSNYKPKLDKIIALAKENKDEEAFAMLSENGEAGKASILEEDSIDKIVAMKVNDAKEKSNLNTANAKSTMIIMIVVIIFTMSMSILIGLYISGLITKPIKRVVNMIEEMGKGHLGERLNINTNDEVGQIAKTMDIFAADLQTYVIGVMNKIAQGDVSMDIPIKDESDEIAPALNKMVENIRALVTDTNILSKAAIEGKLDTRADATKHNGDFRKIVEGVNHTLDSVIGPLNVAAEYVERISKGDIPPKITDKYLGDFNEIKNNLNKCIDVMTGLLSETNNLIKATQEGKLETRGNSAAFVGDWGTLVNGINELIEAMVNPIREVISVMSEMSEGHLEVTVNGDYKGEFGVLAKAVNTTIDSLNSVLSEINTASDQVYTGSSQVSDGSQALSQGATEQASAIEELTSSITEVAAQTKENAVNANEAKDLALKVKENAEEGNRHMSEMLKSMGEINESSANISKIIKVIDEIAFQTNILALNAAVEAARAGQHGKGFAVVAEEVRNLAARSANAAKETTDLIEGSIKKSEKGTEIANNTAKALYEIVDGVSKAATLVAEIAASSNEQATGISQINLGIEQVSQVVQTNSATAQESAAASEELSSQSELLKEMVSSFKLKNGNGNSSSSLHNQTKNYKNKQHYTRENNMAFKEVAATSNKPKIALSDNEFGKY